MIHRKVKLSSISRDAARYRALRSVLAWVVIKDEMSNSKVFIETLDYEMDKRISAIVKKMGFSAYLNMVKAHHEHIPMALLQLIAQTSYTKEVGKIP